MDATTKPELAYRVLIQFLGERSPYEKTGLSLSDAIRLKEYFLESVPVAYSGSVIPETSPRTLHHAKGAQ